MIIIRLTGLLASCLDLARRSGCGSSRRAPRAGLRRSSDLMRGTPPLGAVLGGVLLADGDVTAAIVTMSLLAVPGAVAGPPALGRAPQPRSPPGVLPDKRPA
jgi:hypothetical protein